MNAPWHKLGSLLLVAGASAALALSVSKAQAQSADPPANAWYDKSSADSDSNGRDGRDIQPAAEEPSHPSAAPRAGSPGYSPTYQQPQSDSSRPNTMRGPSEQPYRQPIQSSRQGPYSYTVDGQRRQGPSNNMGNNSGNNMGNNSGNNSGNYARSYTNNGQRSQGPYNNYPQNDPRRPIRQANQGQDYRNPPGGSNAGPYFGYPPARARTVAYRREDMEYADDQPRMGPQPASRMAPGGQPSVSVEMSPQYGPPMGGPVMSGQMMGGPPGEWGGPDEGGCGCAGGSCGVGGCSEGCCNCGCDGCCECGGSWPQNMSRSFNNWCKQDAFRDLSIYAGVQGFKDPTDLGENGDFGFHEGANWGLPLWGCSGVGFQVGAELDHSDLAPNATIFGDHRNQYFITAGAFYRPTRECGWQGGLVWDYLDDEFYSPVTVSQIRGNLSYVVDWSEFGFEFAASTHSDVDAAIDTRYTPVDLYTLYYGRRLCNGGQVKAYLGVANELGAIVGANLDIAISDSFSLDGDFAYIIADKVAPGDVPGESANIAFSIVWHPGCHARDTFDSAYRPLFNVADNSSFIVNRTNR